MSFYVARRVPPMKQFLSLCLVFYFTNILANAISVTNLSLNTASQEVNFDLEWENSWRVDSLSQPFNWDAAWVFVKFAECDSTSAITDVNWEHGKLSTSIAAHSFADLEPVLNDGTIGISDSLGVMLRRTANGIYTNPAASNITLLVNNIDPTKTYHVRVVAIEMVYITEGPFQIGGLSNHNSFDSTQISNENALTLTSLASGANASVDLGAGYPKGFDAFHCMKYEISHGQYTTFLNTLNSVQATARYFSTTAYRRNLLNTGTTQFQRYTTDRPDRALNYMTWDDILAYLDWSALRPMTELQYQKAARGFGPLVPDEYAWGTTTIQNGLQFTGAENGTEFFVNSLANTSYNDVIYIGGDAGRGPARCGIFALPSNTTREQSGAGYYGVMELSGNVYEFCVNVSSFTDINTGSVNFVGGLGDGYLDAAGLWNVLDWPTAGNGSAQIGGSFYSNNSFHRTSSRNYFLANGNRYQDSGGRGIR